MSVSSEAVVLRKDTQSARRKRHSQGKQAFRHDVIDSEQHRMPQLDAGVKTRRLSIACCTSSDVLVDPRLDHVS